MVGLPILKGMLRQAISLIRSESCKYLGEEHLVKGPTSVKTNVLCLRNPAGQCDLQDCKWARKGPEVGEAFEGQIRNDKEIGF